MPAFSHIVLQTPAYFRLTLCATSHGWVNLAPFSYSADDEILFRTEQIGNSTYTIGMSQTGSNLHVKITPKLSSTRLKTIKQRILHSLSFDFPIKEFAKHSRNLSKHIYKGLQEGYAYFLRGFTPFEDAVKTLLTTNCSWAYTKKVSQSICLKYGNQAIGGTYAFPSLVKLKALREREFREIGMGYRSRYIESLCKHFVNKNIRHENWLGFGAYASAHFNFLLGVYDRIPVDREVCRYLKIPYDSQSFNSVNAMYSKWGPYKFLAYKIERRLRNENWIGN
ncbi:MAG: hypothetical protein JW913_11990 [Chitinispirillaceae bacterium]|nr:hypothetical protein [Chitinispirillaceae bacterium]